MSPQLDLRSDASDVGWGAHLGEDIASGLWSPKDMGMSINARELLAIKRAPSFFAPLLQNSSVAVFTDNSTVIAYLRNQGGTVSAADFALGGVSSGDLNSSVYHGSPQHSGGLAVSSQSSLGLPMDP